MIVLATVFSVLAGPKILADQHELMCSWSPGWQRLAGWFGDCSTYAQKHSAPIVITGPADSGDPLERLVRRGYKLDEESFRRAADHSRTEDIDLFLAAGFRFATHPLIRMKLDEATWKKLVSHQAVPFGPCAFDRPQGEVTIGNGRSMSHDEFFHASVYRMKNSGTYRLLCDGRYVTEIRSKAEKALAAYRTGQDPRGKETDRVLLPFDISFYGKVMHLVFGADVSFLCSLRVPHDRLGNGLIETEGGVIPMGSILESTMGLGCS